jgi:hemoglobin
MSMIFRRSAAQISKMLYTRDISIGENMSEDSLYSRLGGYDAISAVCEDLLPRLMGDDRLGRFWQARGEDGIEREKQLLKDFLCANAGGPVYYTGRDMKLSHAGMGIDEEDCQAFLGHLDKTLETFQVPDQEKGQVLGFIDSTKQDIVSV